MKHEPAPQIAARTHWCGDRQSPRQRQDQGQARVLTPKAFHRGKAPARMEGHQYIAPLTFVLLLDNNAVAEFPQDGCPAKRRNPVSLPGARRRRRDNANVHLSSVQVRNPAHTSRRSGP